jgi:hypothetical protein
VYGITHLGVEEDEAAGRSRLEQCEMSAKHGKGSSLAYVQSLHCPANVLFFDSRKFLHAEVSIYEAGFLLRTHIDTRLDQETLEALDTCLDKRNEMSL